MPTIVTKFIVLLLSRPSATKGILWSLGLHATAFAATCTWWLSPIAPSPSTSKISFNGNRYVVQIEASFSEIPTALEVENLFEFEPTLQPPHLLENKLKGTPPPVDLSPLDRLRRKAVTAIVSSALQMPADLFQDDTADEIRKIKRPRGVSPPRESQEIKLTETSKKTPSQPPQPAAQEPAVAVEQFAGVDELVPPDLAGNRPPSYPAEAIRRRLEGVVLLRITVAASGQVERVEVAKSSGHAILDRRAVEAVSTWQARPAEQEGKAVATVEILPIRFRL